MTRAVVEYALRHGLSLSKAAKYLSKELGVEAGLLRRRAKKYVRRRVYGAEAIDLFFNRGSQYDLLLAGRLVCSPDEIADVVAGGGVPPVEACRGLPRERKIYQALYNRVARHYPEKLPSLKKRAEREPTRTPSSFYTISEHELQ